jgi:hypothetical protein
MLPDSVRDLYTQAREYKRDLDEYERAMRDCYTRLCFHMYGMMADRTWCNWVTVDWPLNDFLNAPPHRRDDLWRDLQERYTKLEDQRVSFLKVHFRLEKLEDRIKSTLKKHYLDKKTNTIKREKRERSMSPRPRPAPNDRNERRKERDSRQAELDGIDGERAEVFGTIRQQISEARAERQGVLDRYLASNPEEYNRGYGAENREVVLKPDPVSPPASPTFSPTSPTFTSLAPTLSVAYDHEAKSPEFRPSPPGVHTSDMDSDCENPKQTAKLFNDWVSCVKTAKRTAKEIAKSMK